MLFDLSAAFDTVDHKVVLRRLSQDVGVAHHALIFGSVQQLKKIELHAIHIGDSLITVSHNLRNLGLQFDETTTMESHITVVCKSAIYYLRNIALWLVPRSSAARHRY